MTLAEYFAQVRERLDATEAGDPTVVQVTRAMCSHAADLSRLLAIVECLSEGLAFYEQTDNWPYAKKGSCPGEVARKALAQAQAIAGGE